MRNADDPSAIPCQGPLFVDTKVSFEFVVVSTKFIDTRSQSGANTDAWEKLFTAMTEYDSQMIDRWKSEMDNLLIFVSLLPAFSPWFNC